MEARAWLYRAENGYCFAVIATTPVDFEAIPITDMCFRRLSSIGWPLIESLSKITFNKH